jgi:hypothetical protein
VTSDADTEQPVYLYGLAVTGLADLPAARVPPQAGRARTVAVRIVGEATIRERWRAREPERILERRLADGRLVVAVDADPGVGYRVEAPAFGVHLVSVDGREVLLPEPRGPAWFWQRLLFAQTLPIAATLQGFGLFHASAVRIAGRAVAMSAQSGTGKSSTATHLVARGAEFFTDDVLALEVVDGRVHAFAGPEFFSIEGHEVDHVEPRRRERLGTPIGEDVKRYFRPSVAATSLPLGALYLLERDADVEAVQIESLDGSGTHALLATGFIPHLSPERRLMTHLELCGRMAGAGQVFRVRVPTPGSAAAVALVLREHVERQAERWK